MQNLLKLTTPSELAEHQMRSLAKEIACDMLPLEEILRNARVDYDTFERIRGTPQFKALLAEAVEQWHGATNSRKRVRLKSATIIEDILPSLAVAAVDPNFPATARIELIKALMRAGGVADGAPQSGDTSGQSGVRIVINMGAETTVSVDTNRPKVITHEREDEVDFFDGFDVGRSAPRRDSDEVYAGYDGDEF